MRGTLTRALGCLLLLAPAATACASSPADLTLTVDGEISLVHYVPNTGARPLMVVLHGLGSSAAEMRTTSGMSSFADRNGFAVVYPNAHQVLSPVSPSPTPTPSPSPSPTPTSTSTPTLGPAPSSSSESSAPSSLPDGSVAAALPPLLQQRAALARTLNEVLVGQPPTQRAWDAGAACCGGAAGDDVAYLRRVVRAVAAKVAVDLHRVYVVGLSNGGMMATRAICDAPDLFAAAGTVAGPYLGSRCSRPVWKHLHGGNDPFVPYLGGVPPGASGLIAYDWCRCSFPSSATEARRFGGYVSTTFVPGATHSWPTVTGSWRLDGNAVLWQALRGFRR